MRRRKIGYIAFIIVSACSRPTPTMHHADAAHPESEHAAAEYAERIRFGVGSPFRTIEQMLRDPRIDNHDEVGQALLEQMRRRQMYDLSALVMRKYASSEVSAITQFELIRDAVLRAQDPRVGEMAVNIAYERSGAGSALRTRAAEVAALFRDYVYALNDVRRLVDAAEKEGVRETNLLVRWRADRKFLVEKPTLAVMDSSDYRDADLYAQLLAGGLDAALAARDGTLTRHIDARDVDNAALLLAAFDSAIALRTFAQQDVAPDTITAARLKTAFGVRVVFAKSVTAAQRHQTLIDIYSALTDMRVIMPNVNFSGLGFDVRPIPEGARYQAYHEPRERVIRIDPVRHAGTFAHELGHDLDWQAARQQYRKTARYATDLAATPQTADRPTEDFARRFEWFVASELAKHGRSNAQLSSIQSEWLTGHGWAIVTPTRSVRTFFP